MIGDKQIGVKSGKTLEIIYKHVNSCLIIQLLFKYAAVIIPFLIS